EFSRHKLNRCRSILIEFKALAAKSYGTPIINDFTKRNRLDKIPMVVATHQPAETNLRIVKKILFPEIFLVKGNAALHETNDGILHTQKFTHGANRNNRHHTARFQSF